MALSGVLASTVGILVLISLTNGQHDVNRPIPGCNPSDVAAGIYTMPHPNYYKLFITCSNNNQNIARCPEGTVYDTNINGCNHITQAINSAFPCNSANAGRTYADPCCNLYWRCDGAVIRNETCPTNQAFNAQSGQCGSVGGCVDHAQCVRFLPPSGNQVPCPLVADPSNPCNFRINNNGTLSEAQSCAEGSSLDVTSCTCVANPSCMRRSNSSGGKTPDPRCAYSFRLDFTTFKSGSNVPQVFSDKTGNPVDEYVEAVGVQYGNGQAVMSSNPATGAVSYFYIPWFSSNLLASPLIIEIVFRATERSSFELISNNRDGACSATFSFNATYNGAGSYQVNGFITGGTDVVVGAPVTNVATINNLGISVGQSEHVCLRVIFADRVMVQLINRGTSGTQSGQVVNSQDYGTIGRYLLPNKCGFQVARSMPGIVKFIGVREGCLNTDLART